LAEYRGKRDANLFRENHLLHACEWQRPACGIGCCNPVEIDAAGNKQAAVILGIPLHAVETRALNVVHEHRDLLAENIIDSQPDEARARQVIIDARDRIEGVRVVITKPEVVRYRIGICMRVGGDSRPEDL